MTDSRNDLKDPSVRDEHVFVDDELIAAAEAFLEAGVATREGQDASPGSDPKVGGASTDAYRTDGAAVECPTCGAKLGGMTRCPWDGSALLPLPDADPMAVAVYGAIAEAERA